MAKRIKANAHFIVLCLLPILLAGCISLSESKPPGPWYAAYQPIEDADSQAFILAAREKATKLYGDPVFPVNKILLRRSRKTDEARRYRIGEDFSLTEYVDSTNGIFAIYLAVDPEHPNYYALLGHECAHLLNPYITDWYMEGFATVFSEEICAELGIEWGNWKRHFSRSRKEPYALSYRMMFELKESFPEHYPTIIQFVAENERREGWLRIDIDAWIENLPVDYRAEAFDIIRNYAKQLERRACEQYDFTVPSELGQ